MPRRSAETTARARRTAGVDAGSNASGWLAGLSTLLACACTHAQPAPPSSEEPRVARSYETVSVAPGIHAFIAPEARVGLVTHWHPDHHSGNGVYRELVPEVIIVSTEYTRTEMEKQAGKFDNPANLTAAAQTLRERQASGKKRDGTPLGDEDRQFIRDALEAIDDAIPEFQQIKPAPPDLGFERRIAIDLGKRAVEVSFLGRGNTGGDAVVYVPDARVLITGDLLVAPTPYGIGSFFGEWIQTMHKLEAIDAAAIVPGHGPVQRDKEYLHLVTALLESVVKQTNAAVQQGLTLEETRAKVDLEDFRKRLAADNPVRVRAFKDAFVTPGVARAWREAKEGTLRDED